MGFFDRLFGKEEVKFDFAIPGHEEPKKEEKQSIIEEIKYDFPNGQLVPLEINGILNTNDPKNRAILKHNIEVLVNEAKTKGYIDRFMLIREDEFLPYNSEWIPTSETTALDRAGCELTKAIRYSLNLKETVDFKCSSRFRSTKHFTLNTPLEETGEYNWVDTRRDFIVMDGIDNFINSGYAYSISTVDAYLDITHEPLKISDKAIYLIKKERYDTLIKNPKVAEELKDKNVILFEGEEEIAVDMMLVQRGCIPTRVNSEFATYDAETKNIIEESIKSLAKRNDLLLGKSHAGSHGHFSNFLDQLNGNSPTGEQILREESLKDLANFLKMKFDEHKDLINELTINDASDSKDIVKAIGAENLLEAIKEYNIIKEKELDKRLKDYKTDKETINEDISNIFKTTVKRIDRYYRENPVAIYQNELVSNLAHFFKETNVKKQLEYAKIINELLDNEYTIKR